MRRTWLALVTSALLAARCLAAPPSRQTPVLRGSDPGTPVDVEATGTRRLDLTVDSGGDNSTDHADWAAAHLSCTGGNG